MSKTELCCRDCEQRELYRLQNRKVTAEMFAGALAAFTMSEHRGNDRALALQRGADFIERSLQERGTV